ncbi:unnamed protein product [Durusdinium trenchii]|uniref:Uncharacterized protein n=1 Tax=Durusdinium trenchii TaxID=1381693 RepID=A0ABP0IB04_9DINO
MYRRRVSSGARMAMAAKYELKTTEDVTCKEGRIRLVAIKAKSQLATTRHLNCVLSWLEKVEQLFLDGEHTTGSLKDLEDVALDRLTRLQMRGRNVDADLGRLSSFDSIALKLSGSKVRGGLGELGWAKLQFLDLRGAEQVFGDLTSIPAGSPLKGLCVQRANVTGDVTKTLREHENLMYLHLQHTHTCLWFNQ